MIWVSLSGACWPPVGALPAAAGAADVMVDKKSEVYVNADLEILSRCKGLYL